MYLSSESFTHSQIKEKILELENSFPVAKMVGIPSLIMFSVGAELFKDYIDNESVYYLDYKNNNFERDFFILCDSLKNTNHDFLEKEIVNPLSI